VRWQPPRLLNEHDGLVAITGSAAPLLAGFGLTLAALTVTNSRQVRWPGTATLAAVLSVAVLVAAVQFGAWGRQNYATPALYRDWFDDTDETAARDYYVREMDLLRRVYRVYARRARMSYDLGIILLMLALGLAVAPPPGSAQSALRWVAAGVAWASSAGEICWGTIWFTTGRAPTSSRRGRVARWVAPQPTDDADAVD
jgi:hypothetical protein